MSGLGKLAQASAAVEIGRRYPFLVLGFRVLVRYVLPAALVVGAITLAVYGLRRADVDLPAFSPWYLAAPASLAVLAWAARAAGRRWDIWWRLRMALRVW